MEFKNKKNYLGQTLSTPFILFIAIPIVILDISLEIYHQISFRLLKDRLI